MNDIPLERLSSKQLKAVELLVNPIHKGKTLQMISDELGVNASTLYAWRKQPLFLTVMRRMRELIFDRYCRDVDEAVANAAINGNVSAMKLFYEVGGYMDSPPPLEEPSGSGLRIVIEGIEMEES